MLENIENIRRVFNCIREEINRKEINNSVIENLRKASNNPTYLLDAVSMVLGAYLDKNVSLGYLKEKLMNLKDWIEEILIFGVC